jgi:hypothetical protein
MESYSIRLAGPWRWESAEGQGTIRVPADLPAGAIKLRRAFQWPKGLEAGERLYVSLPPGLEWVEVAVNGQALTLDDREAEITGVTLLRNEIVLARTAGEAARFEGATLTVRSGQAPGSFQPPKVGER